MSSFSQNFQSLINLRKEQMGLQANQQQFEQSRQTQFMPHEIDRMRLGNTRSQFELDRAKGFMPFELRNAETDSASAEFDLSKRKQLMPYELSKLGLENSALSLRNQSGELGLAEQRRLNTLNADMERYDRADRSTASRGLYNDVAYAQADRALSLQGRQYGLTRQRTVDDQQDVDWARNQHRSDYQFGRQRTIDSQQDADWADNQRRSDYQFGRQRTVDGQQDSDYRYQVGRRRVMDSRSDSEYEANRWRRGYADGGPVQDVQAKGFVPVRVSNGEFEFTPEQVANIGAAVLANSGGKAQPPMGLDSMG